MCHTLLRGPLVLFFTEDFLNAGFQYYVYISCGPFFPKTLLLLRYYFSVFECVEQPVINHFFKQLTDTARQRYRTVTRHTTFVFSGLQDRDH
jgi:hypothetical protein